MMSFPLSERTLVIKLRFGLRPTFGRSKKMTLFRHSLAESYCPFWFVTGATLKMWVKKAALLRIRLCSFCVLLFPLTHCLGTSFWLDCRPNWLACWWYHSASCVLCTNQSLLQRLHQYHANLSWARFKKLKNYWRAASVWDKLASVILFSLSA